MKANYILPGATILVLILTMVQFSACSKKSTPYEQNLLKNSSFESVRDGMPTGWTIETFHGLESSKSVTYGVTDKEAFDGERSFYIKGEDDTQRWVTLVQEVAVSDITHIRLTGSMKLSGVVRREGQWSHCNFILMYFDKNHQRFQELRYGDKRTRFQMGTKNWITEDHTFRVPNNTAYISVGCVLGMTGTVYFDNLSLSVPTPTGWVKQATKNFDFYNLPGHEYPEGAIENQQRMFDHFCTQLGAIDDLRISYYLYPDSSTIREMLSLKGVQYISWDDREIHTINPNNDHEIIHFITDQYGIMPKALAEGCVYYLHGNWNGKGVHGLAKELLLGNQLPLLSQMLNYGDMVDIDINVRTPAASSFFGFLYEQQGPEKILGLFSAASGTNSYPTFAVAFKRVYDTDIADVERSWRVFLLNEDFSETTTEQQQ